MVNLSREGQPFVGRSTFRGGENDSRRVKQASDSLEFQPVGGLEGWEGFHAIQQFARLLRCGRGKRLSPLQAVRRSDFVVTCLGRPPGGNSATMMRQVELFRQRCDHSCPVWPPRKWRA